MLSGGLEETLNFLEVPLVSTLETVVRRPRLLQASYALANCHPPRGCIYRDQLPYLAVRMFPPSVYRILSAPV